jgi:hypothetical protein
MRKNKVVDNDSGYDHLVETFGDIDGVYVTVGVHSEQNDPHKDDGSSGINIARLAAVHEYGAEIDHPGVTKPHKIVIPERSFLRATMSDKKQHLSSMSAKLIGKVIDGKMSIDRAFKLLGEEAAALVKERMGSSKLKPLAASTIRKKTVDGKKGTSPLIDTGQLVNSIGYQVHGL